MISSNNHLISFFLSKTSLSYVCVVCNITNGSPFSSTTLLAFSGSFSQSPNHALNSGVRTRCHCSCVKLLGFPLGANKTLPPLLNRISSLFASNVVLFPSASFIWLEEFTIIVFAHHFFSFVLKSISYWTLVTPGYLYV